jgi:DNA-directed RNA polymerase subunit beta'
LDVRKWDKLIKWWIYASKWRSKLKIKEDWDVLEAHKDHIILWVQEIFTKPLIWIAPLKNRSWTNVFKWEILTNWSLDIREYKNVVWDLQTQKYIIKETKKVYMSQWQDLNDKHIEVVVKQLFSKVFIEDSWDSSFIPWIHVRYEEFMKVNKDLEKAWKRPATWRRLILWLTNIAKETNSWLSAASFQETIRVMVGASLKWAIDELSDLKSNVIIWRLLPVWEIFRSTYTD